MHHVKGVDTMLHALTRVPNAYLWIAGEGPAKAKYQALATRLGLDLRVRFLGWRNDRKALLQACDVCVLPSRYEPFGTVIIEAWAMTKPLVATAAAGARQYVTDGVTGVLCPIEDADALAECLRRVLGDAALRQTIAEAGHAAFEKDFTREIVVDRLCASYQRCIRLGPVRRDVTVPAAAPDAAAVAAAYAGRKGARDAALLQASGLASLVVGRPPRVLLLEPPDLDHAWGLFDRAAADVKYGASVDALLAAAVRHSPAG
jgi:hypothetical protein